MSSRIHLLPEHIIDQIKAGEVVEGPGTVLKELLENAVDAHAQKINVHVRGDGLDLIAVTDDGEGMTADELPIAFTRHATSKIERFDDLYALKSFGFRGEALPSIASVSKMSCTSVPRNGESGGQLSIHGGERMSLRSVRPDEASAGTAMYVKDLFYNTPVRLNFLRSKQSEKQGMLKVLHAFWLSTPSIQWSIQWDDREKEIIPIESLEKRIGRILIKSKETPLLSAEREYEDQRVRIYAGRVSNKTPPVRQQYVFVQNRLIADRALLHSIQESIRPLWPVNESGPLALFIDLPESHVDVNVHPNKTLVRFLNPGTIYSLIRSTIVELISSQQTPRAPLSPTLPSTVSPHPWAPLAQTVQEQSTSLLPASIIHSHSSLIYSATDGALMLFSLPRLLGWVLSNAWGQLPHPVPESDITPLLISAPLRLSQAIKASSFETLHAMGLECDPLRDDPHRIVLRSIPTFLTSFPYLTILEAILEAQDEWPNTGIHLRSWKEALPPLIAAIDTRPLSAWVESGIALQLTDKHLARLWERP